MASLVRDTRLIIGEWPIRGEEIVMPLPEVRLCLPSVADLQTLFERELRHRRVFVLGVFELADRQRCSFVVDHPSGATFSVLAEAVYLKPDEPGAGVGLDLVGLEPGKLSELEEFVRAPSTEATQGCIDQQLGPDTPASDAAAADTSQPHASSSPAPRAPRNVHERIRQLNLRERESVGRAGTLTERVALERAFGSSVWESLLQNPQLTAPEVAHIAKNGSLPIPLVSIIVANAGWLASGEVRRALLSNPRVSGQNIERVLRAFPKVELKQVAQMSAYRSEVRSTAHKLCGK